MTEEEAINQAVAIAGGQSALAREIGCSQPSVFRMVQKGSASVSYVLPIEKATGVSRHDLAPKIYPREEAA